MQSKKILSIIFALCLVSSLYAYEMKPVGFKATGMGGTGVASTRGSLAGYYNPALLRLSDHTSEFSLNVGEKLREANLADNMDTLNNTDFKGIFNRMETNVKTQTALSSTDNANLATAVSTLNNIGTNNALQVATTVSLAAQISDAFAIGVYRNADVGMQLKIDTSRLDLIFKDVGGTNIGFLTDGDSNNDYWSYKYSTGAYVVKTKTEYEASSLEYAVDNDLSYVQLDAMVLAEVPISYAKAYDLESGFWSFGINLKLMALTMYDQKVSLGTKSGDANDNSHGDQYKITYKNNFGVDLGIAYRPKGSDMTIGLVGKNVNSPKFKVDDVGSGVSSASDYELDPYFRAGISYPTWNNNIEFALDVDLQKAETIIPGEYTQMIGVGIESHPASWFALRVGAMKDLASDKYDEGTILTAGVGFGLKWFQFDLSAMSSTESGKYDGNTIPRYAAVNLSLVSKW